MLITGPEVSDRETFVEGRKEEEEFEESRDF